MKDPALGGLVPFGCPACGGTLIREPDDDTYECQLGCSRAFVWTGTAFASTNALPSLEPLRLERAGYEPYDRTASDEQRAAGHRRGRPVGFQPAVIRRALAGV